MMDPSAPKSNSSTKPSNPDLETKPVDGRTTSGHKHPHGARGRFIKKHVQNPNPENLNSNPLARYISNNIQVSKKEDDLINLHIGNPLRKITLLLEQIKKQKAFSFTLKGSLGVMGIVLVLSTFGILGGNRLLCDKGRQSHVGVLKVLTTKDVEPNNTPLIGGLIHLLTPFSSSNNTHPRTVLQIPNTSTMISIPYIKNVNTVAFENNSVIITGNYDSCSQVLSLTSPEDIQLYR